VSLTPTAERRHAALALRWLLDGKVGDPGLALDWGLLQSLAQSNAVLVQLDDLFARAEMRRPGTFVAAADAARARAAATIDVFAKVRDVCVHHGTGFVFPSVADHFPDTGNDLDLLVLERSAAIDALLLAATPGVPVAAVLWDRLTGATAYELTGSDLVLDVHHGRLGIIGEHTQYPDRVVRRRRMLALGGEQVPVPAAEDRLILQGMNRVYGRKKFRLGDVVATVRLVREPGLDWTDVVATASALGTLSGLSCYLAYVERLYREIYGANLLPEATRGGLTLEGWGEPVFESRGYRFPSLRVGRRLFWSEFGSVLGARDWPAVSRLCLLPPLVAAGGLRKLARRWFPAPRPQAA